MYSPHPTSLPRSEALKIPVDTRGYIPVGVKCPFRLALCTPGLRISFSVLWKHPRPWAMACRTTKENLSFRTTTEATPIDGHTQETGAQMQTPSTRQTSSPPCVFSPTYRGIVYPIQPAKPPSPESQSGLTRQDGEKKKCKRMKETTQLNRE